MQALLAGFVAGGSALSLAVAPAALAAQEAFLVAEVSSLLCCSRTFGMSTHDGQHAWHALSAWD